MRRLLFMVAALAACMALVAPGALAKSRPFRHIDHFVVIYLENHSFDNLYGTFPGANGLTAPIRRTPSRSICPATSSSASSRTIRISPRRRCLRTPAARRTATRSTATSANAPFGSTATSRLDQKTGDLVHRFYQEQFQIDGGKMDKFVAWSDAERPGDGLLRHRQAAAGRVRQAVHAGRQLLPRRRSAARS